MACSGSAAHHHWERSALRWTGNIKRKHDELADAVTAMGYPIHPDLGVVRDRANALKHHSDK